jgi:hypothetical protein
LQPRNYRFASRNHYFEPSIQRFASSIRLCLVRTSPLCFIAKTRRISGCALRAALFSQETGGVRENRCVCARFVVGSTVEKSCGVEGLIEYPVVKSYIDFASAENNTTK